MSWNVVDHLLELGFKTQAQIGEAAGGASQPGVARWRAENSIPSKRQRSLIANAPKYGIRLSPTDFFPPAPEASAEATVDEAA
ncbi:MAG: hypothetical protein GC208_09565 [Alphaproteobacteria bacterium]|nr:hypothetical protein [Alphaproteobacteria bacterium]